MNIPYFFKKIKKKITTKQVICLMSPDYKKAEVKGESKIKSL